MARMRANGDGLPYLEIRRADIVQRSLNQLFPPSLLMSARHRNAVSVIAK